MESNDENDALPHLLPAVQEHISTTHAGVSAPGNLEDLVRTGMYQGGSEGSTGEPVEPTQSNTASSVMPVADTGVPSTASGELTTNTAALPGDEPSMSGNAAEGADVSSGTYAPNPTVEPPSTTEPVVNPPTQSSPEPVGEEMQPEVPGETPAQSVQAAEDGQTNQ